VGGGGVRRGGHDGNVGLVVVVGVEGEHAREGVVGREGDLQGLVAAGGLGGDVLDVAAQGTLVARHRQHEGEEVGKTLYTSVC